MKDRDGYWKFGRELLPAPEIVVRHKGPRDVLPYFVPKGQSKNTSENKEKHDEPT